MVDFNYSGADLAGLGTLTLDFVVSGSGVVALDAACSSTDPADITAVNGWDSANVGGVTNPLLYGASFSLTGAASSGLNLRQPDGGVLAISGQNPGRIDGNGLATPVPESLVWTFSGTDMLAGFASFEYGNAHVNGGLKLTDADTSANYDLPGSVTAGSIDISADGFILDNGDSLTFAAADLPVLEGAGLSAFTFEVDAKPVAPGSVFDNDSGDSRWITPSNWNPDGLPASPSNAVIIGQNVTVDAVIPESPAALLMSDAVLTISSNGSLLVESMEIGTDLATEERLVIQGATAIFGYAGSSSSDVFTVGSAATIETRPDAGGAGPLLLGGAQLVLEQGCTWILDGSHYTGSYFIGDRFELANFDSLSGNTLGLRWRNFEIPADRDLQLVNTSTSLYYEVVAQTPAAGPNIIVINLDDVSADNYFGFEGRNSLTPTLDSMVAGGIRFTRAFCAATVCAPSRYALLTGRYATRGTGDAFLAAFPLGRLARFTNINVDLEPDGEHIGNWLRQAGYRTGFVGKSHNIDPNIGKTAYWPSFGMVPYGQTDDPATDPRVNGAMKHNQRVVAQLWRERGFDYVGGIYAANLAELRNNYLNYHHQEWLTKHALEFIEGNRHQRFFLYMAPTIDHGPIRADLSRSLGADPDYCPEGYRPGEDYSFMPSRASIVNEVDGGGYDHESARMTWIDYSVQALLNKLAEHGLQNDTLIVFTADHGAVTADTVPKLTGKTSLYESGMKVPLVMYWPAGIVSPGRTYDELVQHTDFVPTFLELAGAAGIPARVVDGSSLVPVLSGSSAALRSEVYAEIGYARGIRTKDWKYIAVRYTPDVYAQIDAGYLWKNFSTGLYTEPRPYYVANSGLGYYTQSDYPHYYDDDQLYNMNSDPTERTNLYGLYPAQAYDLKKRLAGYMSQIPDRPFREFDDASTEFSPAPAGPPAAPGSLQMQFLGTDTVQLEWNDVAGSELGYLVEESTNGAAFGIITELPSDRTGVTVSVSSGIEDVRLRISSYNLAGDTPAPSEVDLLAPDNWRYRTFGSTTSSNSQWAADADEDGSETIWEYAFATDPLDPNSNSRSVGEFAAEGTNSWLQLVVPRDQRRDVSIEGRVSTNLQDWAVGEPGTTVIGATETNLILRSITPVENLPAQFLGAEISIP
jgi:arylsulfatase A-like enzyme